MKLKERNMGKFKNKFCSVVDELITLHELGFVEDGHHRWSFTIHQVGAFSKSLLASGNFLYLRDQEGDKYTDVNMCILWNRNANGPIKKREIEDFINMLKLGNVRT